MRKIYTGIGNRDTPSNILSEFSRIAKILENNQFILRSGGAAGADTAFEEAISCKEHKEIYLPRKRFNYNTSSLFITKEDENNLKLKEICHNFNKNFFYLEDGIKKLFMRNVFQILGKNLDKPSEFVVCYTRDGCIGKQSRTKLTGETGFAIVIAEAYEIPIFNLKNGVSNFYNHLELKYNINFK